MALITREQVQAEPQDNQSLAGTLRAIPDGAAGIAATLDVMVRFTKEYRTNIAIRTMAERIVATVPGKDYYGELAAIQNWVRDNIRYTQDVYDVETVKPPLFTMQTLSGDCDDMALLAGTLINSLGHAIRYVAVGMQEPGVFDHVYVEAKVNRDRWIGVETTENVELGWTPQPQIARMVRHV